MAFVVKFRIAPLYFHLGQTQQIADCLKGAAHLNICSKIVMIKFDEVQRTVTWFRCAAPFKRFYDGCTTNIEVRCTLKYFGAFALIFILAKDKKLEISTILSFTAFKPQT